MTCNRVAWKLQFTSTLKLKKHNTMLPKSHVSSSHDFGHTVMPSAYNAIGLFVA